MNILGLISQLIGIKTLRLTDGVETVGAQTELAPMAGVEVNLLDLALIYSTSRLTQNISAHTFFLITW